MITSVKEKISHTPIQVRSKSSSKVKLPLALRIIQWSYPKIEAIAPSIAHRWFVNLFFSPIRFPIPSHEMDIIQKADRFSVSFDHKTAECYSWGQGPVVLFVHGWAGRASQFKSFFVPFTEAGYRVIAFDAPAHGLTKGSKTSIFDFKNSIMEIEKKAGRIEAIVSHSLGGGASLFALSEGLKVKRFISISTPTLAEEIFIEFASRVNASTKSLDYLKVKIHKIFKRPFEHFMADHFVSLLPQPIHWMIIHDEQDKEASIRNSERLIEIYPSATLIKTSGLGHVRVLRDEKVIEECLKFIQNQK